MPQEIRDHRADVADGLLDWDEAARLLLPKDQQDWTSASPAWISDVKNLAKEMFDLAEYLFTLVLLWLRNPEVRSTHDGDTVASMERWLKHNDRSWSELEGRLGPWIDRFAARLEQDPRSARDLFVFAVKQLQFWFRYLRFRWDYDAERDVFLQRARVIPGLQNDADLASAYAGKFLCIWFNSMAIASNRAVAGAARQNADPNTAVLGTALEVLRQGPGFLAYSLKICADERAEHAKDTVLGLVWFSGWTAAQLSTSRSYPLGRALMREAASRGIRPRDVLFQELPGTVASALAAIEQTQTKPRSWKNHIAELLTAQASPEQWDISNDTDLDRQDDAEPSPEEFALRQEAGREIRADLQSHGMTSQEAEVWILATLGNKQREIAEQLQKSTNTVGVLKSRADARLRTDIATSKPRVAKKRRPA